MVIFAGHAQTTLKFSQLGSDHYAYCVIGNSNADDHDAEYIVENTVQDFSESLAAFVSVDWSLVEAKTVTAEGGFFIDNETIPGGAPAGSISPNVTFLLKKVTFVAGRSEQGRMFLPGAWEAIVSPTGVVDATIRDDLTTAANAFVGKLAADGIDMVILHTNPVNPPTRVVELNCDNRVATQRRRLR